MATAKPRVKVPKSAAKGEIIEIKTLITHPMESGQRKGKDGKLIPRKIINQFVCTFNGAEVFSSNWHGAVSANPYMAFNMRADKNGTFEFKWVDDDGSAYTTTADLTVN